MATLSTFIGVPVSITLGAVSLAGLSVSGMLWCSSRSIERNPRKSQETHNIVTSALAVFETSVSKVLNIGKVEKWEFIILQMFYLRVLSELANIDHKMETETRAHLQKSILEEINDLKKAVSSAS